MQIITGIVVFVATCVTFLIPWVMGWRFLISPSFRHRMRHDLHCKSLVLRTAEASAIALGFIVVNGIIAVVLWRILVGPIKPIHEW
jgi:hypothetical protein